MNPTARAWILLAAIATTAASGLQASESHYINGSEGMFVATFPAPGVYFRQYNLYYTANRVYNNQGDKMNLDFSLDSYMNFNRIIYSSNVEILGGRWVADVVIPFVYSDVDVSKTLGQRLPDVVNFHNYHLEKRESSGGLSDIVIEPFYIAWNKERFDAVVGVGLFVPSGRYDSKNPVSPGRGFYTLKMGGGVTHYLDAAKTWSFSWAGQYETHWKQKETNITAGDHFHIEWGLGKRFAEVWQAGVAGYANWQVTEDKGPNASQNKLRVYAVGPEIGLAIPSAKTQITLRSLWEFGARNSAQGNLTCLTATIGF